MSSWYYMEGGQQKGPISEDELRTLASSGRIRPDDLVWSEGMAEWSQARNLDGITWPSAPPPPPPPRTGQPSAYRPTNTGSPQQLPNYLPWAIAATILCCVPTGIASIVYSSKATNAQNIGDHDAARKAADNAKLWLIISVVAGLIVGVIAFIGGVLEEL